MSTKIFVDDIVGAEMLMFRRPRCIVFAAVCCLAPSTAAQSRPTQPDTPRSPYTLHLPVDEVVLTFNAEDADGLPVNDLKAGEIRVWDNGAAPRRIIAFNQLVDRPIRAGILLDTSESMQQVLPANRAVAEKFSERLFRQKSDEAFVSEFGYASELLQP